MIYFDVLAQTGDSWQLVISESGEQGSRMLTPAGTWSEWVPEGSWSGSFPEATLRIPGQRGLSHREITRRLREACEVWVPPTGKAETEALKESLEVERRRVDRILDLGRLVTVDEGVVRRLT